MTFMHLFLMDSVSPQAQHARWNLSTLLMQKLQNNLAKFPLMIPYTMYVSIYHLANFLEFASCARNALYIYP